jgi:hypothetical protein
VIVDLHTCRIKKLVGKKIAGSQVISRYLKPLVELGVLKELSAEKMYSFFPRSCDSRQGADKAGC